MIDTISRGHDLCVRSYERRALEPGGHTGLCAGSPFFGTPSVGILEHTTHRSRNGGALLAMAVG